MEELSDLLNNLGRLFEETSQTVQKMNEAAKQNLQKDSQEQ